MRPDRWADAYAAETAAIEAHPRFRQLVREVAIAEQSNHPGSSWASRNSRTYGTWMTRGMPFLDKNRRARRLSSEIAVELWGDEDRGTSTFREREHKVYGAARVYVRNRRLP